MFTTSFWRAAFERALRTFAQTLAALLTVGPMTSIVDIDWQQFLGVAALASLLSLLTSVAASGVGPAGPSFGPESVEEIG